VKHAISITWIDLSCRWAGAVIDSGRCLTPTRRYPYAVGSHRPRCAPVTCSAWTPDGGVSFDDHLGRDDLVVRLPQFHPLVITGARR
jgi:hypothetical protein